MFSCNETDEAVASKLPESDMGMLQSDHQNIAGFVTQNRNMQKERIDAFIDMSLLMYNV